MKIKIQIFSHNVQFRTMNHALTFETCDTDGEFKYETANNLKPNSDRVYFASDKYRLCNSSSIAST